MIAKGRRAIIACLLAAALATACRLTGELNPQPTALPTFTYTPSPVPSATPSPTPSPSPTPLPAARNAQGELALFYGDWEAANAAYEAALAGSEDPDVRGRAMLGLARTRFLAGDYPNALELLRELIQTYPDTPILAGAHFLFGQVYDVLDRHAEAAEAYQQYTDLRPGIIDRFVHSRRAAALERAGIYPSAIEAYQAALAAPGLGDGLDLEVRIGVSQAAQGEYESALVTYAGVAARSNNDFTRAQMDLLSGQALLQLGRTEEAYDSFLHAVENYPLSFDSYSALVALVNAGVPVNELDRGLVDYFAGQYGVAIAAFDRYLAGNPETGAGTALYYRGLAYRALDDSARALQGWDEVIRSHQEDPNWDEAWEQKAFTQWAYLGDYPAAIQTLVDFVAASPAHPRAAEFLFDAGRVSERDGDLERAATLWERVAVEYPTAEIAYDGLYLSAITLYRLGDHARARIFFERTLGLAQTPGQQAAVQFWIGKSEQAQGEGTAARAAWERAAMADPTGYYSERARDLLFERAPFDPPEAYDTSIDWTTERAQAEAWMRTTFPVLAEVDLSGLGPLQDDPRVIRGQELWALGLYSEARVELEDLRLSIQTDPELNYRLANFLVELGLYRSAVFAAREVLNLAGLDDAGTLIAPRYFNRIRFGTYYGEMVAPLAEAYDFHPLFVYSVMRQESLFEGFIRSSAGARGLMQIIPTTGQAIFELNGWPPGYTAEDLYRPKVSLTFGVDHLADLRAVFDGDLYTALAGYNAGQGNAAVWKALAPDDPDLYVEVIRFEETRRYIRAIYEIYSIYRRLYDRSP